MDAAGDPLTDLQAFTSKRSSLRDKLKKRREALGTLLSQTSDSEQVSSGTKVEVEAVGGDGVQVGDEVAIGGADLRKVLKSQCGNSRNFLSFKFYVKSKLTPRRSKTAVFAIFGTLNFGSFGKVQPSMEAKNQNFQSL